MSNIRLVHSFVVEQILSIPTKCKFVNYGGNDKGLYGRIMATFNIVETGHLQNLYKNNERFTFEPLVSLIKSKLQNGELEDLIDIWKEICNKEGPESTVMHFAGRIESALIYLGHRTNHFLYLEAPIWTTKLKSVDNAIKSASDYLEKVLNSETSAKYEKYLYRLSRTLVTYPYIQKTFIEFNFSKLLLKQLEDISDIKLRTDTLKDKIKKEQNAIAKKTKAEHSQEGTRKMVEKMKEMHQPKEENFSVWQKETIYEGKERFVHFMGIEHLVQSAIEFTDKEKRVDQELSLIHDTLLDLINKGTVAYAIYAKGVIKSIIHRSYHQEKLCRDVLIDPSNWAEFEKADPRKRGMIIDEILDNLVKDALPKVKVEKVPADLSQHPPYPNLTEEEEPVKDSLYMQLIKTVHPEAYETIKASGDESEENINAILSHHVKGLGAEPPKSSLKYELPKGKRSEVIIKGNPEDPMVQQLAEMFNVDINKVKPVEPSEQELSIKEILSNVQVISNFNQLSQMLKNRPTFKSRLTENLDRRKTGMDRVNKIEAIARELDAAFEGLTGIDPSTLKGECQDPDCPVHGNKKINISDMIIGIDPVKEDGRFAFINPDLGKSRSKGPFDFSGMLKFLENQFDLEPKKPTVSEIETTSKVIINQSFIINDIDGNFFCEYKMIWSPTDTRFMFSHDEPGSDGRQFHHIRELSEQMTQDKAFARFQALRRNVITYGAHNPRLNPFTSR